MFTFKKIQKILANVALLATIISFSGFITSNEGTKPVQTELVKTSTSIDYTTIKEYSLLKNTSKKVTYNQYIIFNFKSLLTTCDFDFNVRYKTQKKAILQFTSFNSLLEQNLIAKTLSDKTPHILIK